MKISKLIALIACAVYWLSMLMGSIAVAGQDIAEPSGYKMDDYRSKTPQTLTGANVVDAQGAKQLYDAGKVHFVDVLPSPKRPADLAESDVWLPKPRMNIPGSIWLADVGFGVLSEDYEQYFRSNLNQLIETEPKGLLFYCKADCWMSWNAAKRAMNYGHEEVYWFPGGVDDWSAQGYKLEQAEVVEKIL